MPEPNKDRIIRELIKRTRQDFENYYLGKTLESRAGEIVAMALAGNKDICDMKEELESMIPDTNDDGSWECSYALNTGVMILNLIDYLLTEDDAYYDDAVLVFFDSVDFKVQQDFERQGIGRPSEEQILDHEFYQAEKHWFAEMTGLERDEKKR